MKDFGYYLNQIGEIGFIEEIKHSIVHVSGLPKARPNELVVFESGEFGQVVSLDREILEILLLERSQIRVGDKVARTDELLQVKVSDELLGKVVDPLMNPIDGASKITKGKYSPIDTQPHIIVGRKQVDRSLDTGVSIVDLAVPLAKGQRELVIGDRKTGKTEFLLQTMMMQAIKGTVCIYAVIGGRLIDIENRAEFIRKKGVYGNSIGNSIIVATSSSDPSGLIYLTPYTAMTIAEYFRDKGRDVLLILDDLTTHARYYREISLLAKRFPGRGAYPGDIFYTHARLIERAGNFKKGSISCLPVAESQLGDLSGYIQTNLMAMTDGHIFFDIDIYNQGKRPAVNVPLSVTRVGHQAQTKLLKSLSRELGIFIAKYEKMKQFMHFGAEVGENVISVLNMGSKIDSFFDQPTDKIIALNVSIIVLTCIWAGVWNEIDIPEMRKDIEIINSLYQTDAEFRKQMDDLIGSKMTFMGLINTVRQNKELVMTKVEAKRKVPTIADPQAVASSQVASTAQAVVSAQTNEKTQTVNTNKQ